MNSTTQINIFAGTGGVGKTTLATSKAIFEAQQNKKVLLITIDPSLRLKQLINLENNEGYINKILIKDIINSYGGDHEFSALCFNPLNTFKKITKNHDFDKILQDNRILKILTQPFGAMNEIMAYIELSYHYFSNEYDLIILDTPPGKNFVDFIHVFEKLNTFFNFYFFEIFKYLPSIKKNKNTSIFKKIVNSGIDKALHYLEKVTGPVFIEEFINTISILYEKKDIFLKASTLKDYLNNEKISTIFLTTSIDQIKLEELKELLKEISSYISSKKVLTINKSLSEQLESWAPTNNEEQYIKDHFLFKENKIKNIAHELNLETVYFSENLSVHPYDHLISLINEW